MGASDIKTLIGIVVFLVFLTSVHAQEEISIQISEYLEKTINQRIAKHISAKEFNLHIEVSVDKKSDSPIPYLPDRISLKSHFHPKEYLRYIKSVSITLMIDARFKDMTKNALESIIARTLKSYTSVKPEIKFEDLRIDLEPRESEIEKIFQNQIENAERRYLMALSENKKIISEKEQIQNEIKSLQNNLKDKETMINTIQNQQDFISLIKKNLQAVILAICWLLGIIFLIFILFVSGRSLAQAFKMIASSLGKISESFSESSSAKADDSKFLSNKEDDQIDNIANTTDSVDSITQRIANLRREMFDSSPESTFLVFAEYLLPLIESQQKSEIMTVIDFLGAGYSEQVISLFNKEDKENIYGTIANFKSAIRPDKTLEVAENIKSKLIIAKNERFKLSKNIKRDLLQLKDKDIADLLASLKNDLAARLMLHLQENRLSNLLTFAKANSSQNYMILISLLADLPKYSEKSEYDSELEIKLTNKIKELNSDTGRIFLPFYIRLLEHADDQHEEIITSLQNNNQTLGKLVKSKVISFSYFYELDNEYRDLIYEKLNNKEIAIIFEYSTDEQRNILDNGLTERRKERIKEEWDVLKENSSRQKDDHYKKVKNKILGIMKAMRAEGSLPNAS